MVIFNFYNGIRQIDILSLGFYFAITTFESNYKKVVLTSI